jgi:hypothetical protein
MSAVLKRVSNQKCSEIEIAAVAIKTAREGQLHVGIAFRESEEVCALLHLPWHRRPLRGQLDTTFFWVQHSIDPLRLYAILAFCDLVHQRNPGGVPYGFDAPNDCFDRQTGQSLLGPSGRGLTCATFVLAIYQAVGICLLEFELWPARQNDISWQQGIIEDLQRSIGGADAAHIEVVREGIGAIRVRPEEVAGASSAAIHPASFEETISLASEVLAQLPNS